MFARFELTSWEIDSNSPYRPMNTSRPLICNLANLAKTMGILWIFAVMNSAYAQTLNTKTNVRGTVSQSASELFRRMHDQGEIEFETAIGGYVMRVFNRVSDENQVALMANIKKSLEQAKAYRIANERALGHDVDEAVLDAEVEANLKKMSKKLAGRGLQTYAVKYFQKGDLYRIEQFALPNDIDLDKLRDDLKTEKIQFRPTYIRTWNGKQYAEIAVDNSDSIGTNPDLPATPKPSPSQPIAAIAYDNRAAGLVKFTTYARDSAVDQKLLTRGASEGLSATTRISRSKEGDEAIVLSVARDNVQSVSLEFMVLPSKGYSIRSGVVKAKGGVISREEYGHFVQTSAGFWLPTEILREAYKLADNQDSYLSSKQELLAFSPPQTNVPLSDETFDLASSAQFKALRLSTHLLPQGDPLIKKPEPLNSLPSVKVLLIIINILVIAGIGGLLLYRKWSRQRSS